MMYKPSPRAASLLAELDAFMRSEVEPCEVEYAAEREGGANWQPSAVVERLKAKARSAGLWNLFLPDPAHGAGLSNLDYAPLAERMGHVAWASEVFNCSAPDTGNMELLAHYGSEAQRSRWLEPLLDGTIRSAYAMTEPDVASSDATNISLRVRREGEELVLDGDKWWVTGMGHPRCELIIVMGRSGGEDPHRRHSTVLVPRDTPGVEVLRGLRSFGYDDAPHGHYHLRFREVRVPASNLVLGEGRGFEIAQGRLGPGRIHHCMRSIGAAERALSLLCRRVVGRTAFGRTLAEHGVWRERIAEARCRIDMARLLTLKAAAMMDEVGNKVARREIAMIKVVAPRVACEVIDWAIQAHGAAGVSQDFGLAEMYANQRTLRIADGPDEVHRESVAKLELRAQATAACSTATDRWR
jgi:acyl-CoA dehydrogenase